MAKNTTKKSAGMRPIRFDQFKKQLEEVGVENLQKIEMNADEAIWIRLGNGINADDQEEFEQRLEDAADSEETAMVVLDYYPGATAEEQWDIFTRNGGTADDLAIIFANATREQAERLGKIRTRRS